MKIFVTGGAGFIGCHFIRRILKQNPGDTLVNLDALTYAGKEENLKGVASPRYRFVRGNIGDKELVTQLFAEHDFDAVVNFAAESHVDKSIKGPRIFVDSNVTGVCNLLEVAYRHWKDKKDWRKTRRFLQVSTDEVYGSLGEEDEAKFTEDTSLDPSSPYSASKAGADLLVRAYARTFGMPVLITRSSNNYGPHQDTEKFMPVMILCALKDQKLPLYGDGRHIRDWLYVEDNCEAIDTVLRRAAPGSVYNIGGADERRNRDVACLILKALGKPETLLGSVQDRPGHDRRYAIDGGRIKRDLEWTPRTAFESGLKTTVDWFVRRYGS